MIKTKSRPQLKRPTTSTKRPAPFGNDAKEKAAAAKKAEQIERNQAAIALLRSWRECSEEEAQEQRETGAYLMRVLDEDRLSSNRKLFP